MVWLITLMIAKDEVRLSVKLFPKQVLVLCSSFYEEMLFSSDKSDAFAAAKSIRAAIFVTPKPRL